MKRYRIEKDQHLEIELIEPGEYEVTLAGEGASVLVGGRFSASGSERIEVAIILRHEAKHTRADTTLKGVVRDTAFLKFTGRIIIEENCGDTNSFLTERILLLSDSARAEAIPDLEIKTDDVKCSHAASISKIPDTQLFYLQSRGIKRSDAEKLIVEGFLAKQHALRRRLEKP